MSNISRNQGATNTGSNVNQTQQKPLMPKVDINELKAKQEEKKLNSRNTVRLEQTKTTDTKPRPQTMNMGSSTKKERPTPPPKPSHLKNLSEITQDSNYGAIEEVTTELAKEISTGKPNTENYDTIPESVKNIHSKGEHIQTHYASVSGIKFGNENDTYAKMPSLGQVKNQSIPQQPSQTNKPVEPSQYASIPKIQNTSTNIYGQITGLNSLGLAKPVQKSASQIENALRANENTLTEIETEMSKNSEQINLIGLKLNALNQEIGEAKQNKSNQLEKLNEVYKSLYNQNTELFKKNDHLQTQKKLVQTTLGNLQTQSQLAQK